MSFLTGRDIFLKRSELNVGANGVVALLIVIVTANAAARFYQAFDGWFVGSTLVSQLIVMGAGLLLVSQFFLRRANFKARWGARAFAIAWRWLAMPGLTLVGMGLAHFPWIEGEPIVPRAVALILFWYLVIIAVVLWLRAILTLGIDNLSMLYVYFPDESRLVQSNIYGVLRHPVYAAVIRAVFALAVLNGSALALLAGLITPFGMTAWLRLVEERELIERFGESYRAYRARVPAFFNFNPSKWLVLWRFLLTGK